VQALKEGSQQLKEFLSDSAEAKEYAQPGHCVLNNLIFGK
jgi:hypothetical protein